MFLVFVSSIIVYRTGEKMIKIYWHIFFPKLGCKYREVFIEEINVAFR